MNLSVFSRETEQEKWHVKNIYTCAELKNYQVEIDHVNLKPIKLLVNNNT